MLWFLSLIITILFTTNLSFPSSPNPLSYLLFVTLTLFLEYLYHSSGKLNHLEASWNLLLLSNELWILQGDLICYCHNFLQRCSDWFSEVNLVLNKFFFILISILNVLPIINNVLILAIFWFKSVCFLCFFHLPACFFTFSLIEFSRNSKG